MRLFILLLLLVGSDGFLLHPSRGRQSPAMAISRATLQFEFPSIPYAAAVHYIHSPEQIVEMNKLGGPLFQIQSVDAPRIGEGRSSISFVCSAMFAKNVRVRMFATQPNESNLVFYKDNCALYSVKLSVDPLRAFTSHRLRLDVALYADDKLRLALKTLMPLILYVNQMSEARSFEGENPFFAQYRRSVLRSRSSDEFWIMAERVMREYSS